MQDYIDQELNRYKSSVKRMRAYYRRWRQERLEYMERLTERMKDIDTYARDCDRLMHGEFGFAPSHMFWDVIDNKPRMNHTAYLSQLVGIALNVTPEDVLRVLHKLPVSDREALNARIEQQITNAMTAREVSGEVWKNAKPADRMFGGE